MIFKIIGSSAWMIWSIWGIVLWVNIISRDKEKDRQAKIWGIIGIVIVFVAMLYNIISK